jgi:hypothetical protein
VFNNAISKKLGEKDPLKNNDVQHINSCKTFGLLIVKNHLPIQFVKRTQLKRVAMHLRPRVSFPSKTIHKRCCQI